MRLPGIKYLLSSGILALRNVLFLTIILTGIQSSSAQTTYQVGSMLVLGNEKTKEWVILREISIQEGDTISAENVEKILDKSQDNIYNLGLFNEVSIKHQVVESILHVFITVKERWYIFASPIFGIQERNTYDILDAFADQDFHRIYFGLSLGWRNITGRNDEIKFSGQLGFSKKLGIDFTRPALFRKQNIDLFTGFSYQDEREIILGTEMGRVQWRGTETESFLQSVSGYMALRKRFSIYKSLLVQWSYRSFNFSDSLYLNEINGFPAKVITQPDGWEYYPSLMIVFAEDHRDLRSYPLRGYKYQLLGRYTGPRAWGTTSFGKVGFSWAHHLPIGKRWNFAYGFQNLLSIGDSIPFFEKSFIGVSSKEFSGISTNIRGYEPYAVDGSFINMNKAEIKYAIFPRKIIHIEKMPFRKFQDVPLGIYLSIFCDTGYIIDNSFNNQDAFLKNQFLTGYGAGLNIIGIYDMLLRIEYSRNHLGSGGVFFHGSVPIK